MFMRGVFITGTDTGVGKTITSALLISALRSYEIRSKYFKPVQTGLDDDTTTLISLTETEVVPPVFKFKSPISPHRAASKENGEIILSKIKDRFEEELNSFLVVEGAGGLMVP